MQKETLSTSQPNPKPKIELPDKTLVGVKPSAPKEPKKLGEMHNDLLWVNEGIVDCKVAIFYPFKTNAERVSVSCNFIAPNFKIAKTI